MTSRLGLWRISSCDVLPDICIVGQYRGRVYDRDRHIPLRAIGGVKGCLWWVADHGAVKPSSYSIFAN